MEQFSQKHIAAVAIFIAAVAAATFHVPISDLLFYHLVIGEWISAQRQVPTAELWAGRDATWLYSLLLAQIDSVFSARGVYIAACTFHVLFFFVCALVFVRRAGDGVVGVLLAVLTALGVTYRVEFSPWLLGCIGYVALLYLSTQRLSAGIGVVTLVVSALLANTSHLYPLALLVAVLGSIGGSYRFAAIVIAGGLVSPYGGLQVVDSLQESLGVIAHALSLQQEPATIFHYDVGMLVVSAIIAFTWLARNVTAVQPVALGSFVVMLIVAAVWRDAVPLALIHSAFFAADLWKNTEDKSTLGGLAELFLILRQKLPTIPLSGAAIFCFAIIVVSLRGSFLDSYRDELQPVAAWDFAEEQVRDRPLWYPTEAGAYLMYRSDDAQRKSFVTSQLHRTDPAAAYHRENVLQLRERPEESKAFAAAEVVLLRRDTPLHRYVRRQPEWRVVFDEYVDFRKARREAAGLPHSLRGSDWLLLERVGS